MKPMILFNILIVVIAVNCFADPNTPRITSDEYELYIRISPSYKMAEDELRSVYNELFKKLSPEEREDLKRSQLNWIRSRDERAFEVAPKGSEDYIRALIKITGERIKELNTILETRSSQSGKSLQPAKYRAPEKPASGTDFTALFSDKPVGYIDVWNPSYEEQERIWRLTGVCKKIKKEKEDGKEFAKCYRTIKNKSSGEIIQTGAIIKAAARGNFTGKGYNEIVLDVSEDHKSHVELYGSMYFIRNGKIVAQFTRLGDAIFDLFASINTKSGKTKLLALSYRGFIGGNYHSLLLCNFLEKSPNKYKHFCKTLMSSTSDTVTITYEKGYDFSSEINAPEFADINGDGVKDLLVKVSYEIESYDKGEYTLIGGKSFIAEFVFNGETFEPTPKTKKDLKEFKRIEDEISKRNRDDN